MMLSIIPSASLSFPPGPRRNDYSDLLVMFLRSCRFCLVIGAVCVIHVFWTCFEAGVYFFFQCEDFFIFKVTFKGQSSVDDFFCFFV